MQIIKTVKAVGIANQGGVATLQGFEGIFENITTVVLGFSGIGLFVMLILGGFKYITSGGDPKAAEAAKKTLTYAVGGMVLVASAFLILRIIKEITGANVTTFQVFRP